MLHPNGNLVPPTRSSPTSGSRARRCAGSSRQRWLTGDDAFETAVGSVWENGGSRRIADMTDFEWDGLRIFAEG